MPDRHFYITTPIYYVNDLPHIGHAYTTILADTLARFQRLRGRPTHFLTGTDEHGQKVQRAAAKAGMTPQEQADQTVVRFQELWRRLDIRHDDFIRTTEPRHTAIVQKILADLYARDLIYKDRYDGWYCVPCERFYTDTTQCAECGRELEQISESNYFFRMSSYQNWLLDYINQHPEFIQPEFRRNETLGFLQKPLNDLCISRPKTRLSWGIELPFDRDYVTYVWFDALINYISAVGYLADDQKFNRWWPASCHLIGKDILITHTVYWPTMLQAIGLSQPQTIFAHGWWLTDNAKMSKSAGNVVNPMDLIEKYGADPFRYFLMAEMTLGQDCNFSEAAFIRRYNADLANDLGNLLSRTAKMINNHCDRKIPAPSPKADGPEEAELRAEAEKTARRMFEHLDTMRLDLALAEVTGMVRNTNRYLEKRQPWTLAKQKETDALHTTLYHAAEILRIAAGLLAPVMPGKTAALRGALGLDPAAQPVLDDLSVWGKLPPGQLLPETPILFPRIDATAIQTPAIATPTPPPAKTPTAAQKSAENVALVEYADFAKLELRTARILSAECVPNADRLLRLQIQIGDETRQLVAGIAKYYRPETLPGKTIVVVANLKPARIRGVESQGMLLAASHGEQLRLITVDGELPDGAVVK
ncbi:MAG: methionine--tRNA ligase [Kiritimatiellia bacterium]|jgi:methionyl-tRNA synthetase